MSWFLRASVLVWRKDCISFQTRPKWMLNFMLKPCCRNLFKNADLFSDLASSFNRTAHLHTWQSWLKTGLLPTAVNSLVKMNGLRTRLTYHVWGACLNTISHFNPSRRTSMSSRKFCSWYWTSCHKTRSRKPYWASRRLQACVKAGNGHFEHTLKWTRPTCQILVCVITVNVSWQWKLQLAVDYSVQNWKCGIEYLYSHN